MHRLILLHIMTLMPYGVASSERDEACARLSNGCSIQYFYHDVFTSSCDRHDVCYMCGHAHGVSRGDCDEGFLHDLRAACQEEHEEDGHQRRRHRRHVMCYVTAITYYGAVRLFGARSYSGAAAAADDFNVCEEPWVATCLP